jgi:putative oxidoreductase
MFFDSLGKFKDAGLLFSRLIIGASFIYIHGAGKLFGGPERWERTGRAMSNFGIDFLPGVWGFIAACSEFFGGILILLGFFFRPAALLMIITMLVAASRHYYSGDLLKMAYPLELTAILIVFLFLGPGRYNLEKYL